MVTDRPFEELNLWQRIFAEHYFAQKRGISPEEYPPAPRLRRAGRRKLDERFGNRQTRCEKCGSTKMLLIRIWSREMGVIYEIGKDDPPLRVGDERSSEARNVTAPCMSYDVSHAGTCQRHSREQLVFAF